MGQVLDEGIDVPDADLGIVMSASRTRRQMIHRVVTKTPQRVNMDLLAALCDILDCEPGELFEGDLLGLHRHVDRPPALLVRGPGAGHVDHRHLDVDVVVVATSTPDNPMPSTGSQIAHALGITAGASAPDVLVEEMIDAFAERYEIEVETVSTAEESVFFPLPRDLRSDAAE